MVIKKISKKKIIVRDSNKKNTKRKGVSKKNTRVKISKGGKIKSTKITSKKAKIFIEEPLAIGSHKDNVFLLFRKISNKSDELYITKGKSDTKFDGVSQKISISTGKNKKENITKCSDYRFSSNGKILALTYLRNTESGQSLVYAESKDTKKWAVKDVISKIKTAGVVTFNGKKKDTPNIFFGDFSLRLAKKNKTKWDVIDLPKAPYWHFFEGIPFSVSGELLSNDHFIVFYSAEHTVDILKDVSLRDEKIGEERLLKIGAAIFSKDEYSRLLWQTELPVIEVPIETHGRIKLLGIVSLPKQKEKTFRIYTASEDGQIGYIDLPEEDLLDHRDRKQILLKKWQKNPIITPSDLKWENEAVFNPTALHLDGKVHLLYRAIGSDGMSSIGYASSPDGLHIDERLKKPVYSPHLWFENPDSNDKREKSESLFASGGGWGGCEDPKMTQIDDKIYVTYVAHTGVWPTRTVLTSISVDDFLNKKWKWSKSQLMSPPGVGSKSVVLLPEKINGNYYIFHRRWPNIYLDIVPDLEFGEGKRWLTGQHMIRPRKSFWDSHKLSVGAAPIKTKDGWLTVYNAVDRLDSSKYKIGAMLLDLEHPEKVLARSRKPILSPEEFYENDGKPGIAYPGGAVVIDGILHVYYGGGDKVCCLAQIPVDELIWHLKKDSTPQSLKLI